MWVLLTAVSRRQPRGGTHTRSSSASSPGGRGSVLGRPFVDATVDSPACSFERSGSPSGRARVDGSLAGSDPLGFGMTGSDGALIGWGSAPRSKPRSFQLLQEHRERLQRAGIEPVVRRYPRAG